MASESDRPDGLEDLESSENSNLVPRPSPPASVTSSNRTSSTSSSVRRRYNTIRAISFVTAVVSALCGNSISVFSLYAPVLQQHLRYNQFQVNGLAIAASISLYLPVPFFGYICDRFGPAPLSGTAALAFGVGYGVAGILYNYVDDADQGMAHGGDNMGWAYAVMLLCFVAIGVGTCSMYLSSVAVTAKNFGKGQYRGLALAIPITGFGLSGMWLSQLGGRVLCDRNVDGTRGDVNVYEFFAFLAGLLAAVGTAGVFFLRVVNEEELIEEAVEELTGSGILDGSALLGRRNSTYGTVSRNGALNDEEAAAEGDSVREPDDEDDAQWKKEFLLNAETRRFLSDHTMWLLAAGFFLIIGPGEAFINNMGTVIGTLYNPSAVRADASTSPATHVSIVAFTSTAARILTGSLSDVLAPKTTTDHPQVPSTHAIARTTDRSVSRVSFLLCFAITMSIGFLVQASGLVQEHGERFWIVSSLVGLGYGGVFSITPIIITVIWGVENFATNWGIVAMFPAVGSVVWGLVYSAVYTAGAKETGDGARAGGEEEDLFCYGTRCYAPAFWAMTASIWVGSFIALWAWKGRNGWDQRRVVV